MDILFRIAICDDDIIMCSHIEEIILDYQKKCIEKMDILVFFSGEELCNIMKKGQAFDLIFLDIELKKISGIEVGRVIREEFKDNITQIVYISAKQDYAIELFENRPLHFLIKPICREKIIKSLKLAMDLHKNNNLFFEFSRNYTFYKVPYKEILYFASNNKKIRIITTNGEYEFYGKLSEFESKLKEKNFIQIHKSHLVNYQYIAEVSYERIKLSNGEMLNISQSYRKDVRNSFIERRKGN